MQGHCRLNFIKAFKTSFLWYLDLAGYQFTQPELQIILELNKTRKSWTSVTTVGHPQEGRCVHRQNLQNLKVN